MTEKVVKLHQVQVANLPPLRRRSDEEIEKLLADGAKRVFSKEGRDISEIFYRYTEA